VSTTNHKNKEIVKELLKAIHKGVDPAELKKEFGEVLTRVSPFEIAFIEQELVKEGIPVSDILNLCDLHVALFRDFLATRELKNVPKGHPIDLLTRENEWILKQAEALGIYAQALTILKSPRDSVEYLNALQTYLRELKKIRIHYRKLQMLVYPYLERRGIVAVPRVLWGREDQVIVKIREIENNLEKAVKDPTLDIVGKLAQELIVLSKEIQELVFRENKILYPAIHALFTEGEWAAIAELSEELGYIVEVGDKLWVPEERPLYPYEVQAVVEPEQMEKLPEEFKSLVKQKDIQADTYKVKRDGDLELPTGFLTPREIDGVFRAMPIEITYADMDDRVRFFSESEIAGGFPRSKTILGRLLYYCHPPRLENYVKVNVEALKKGQFKYREFWTRMGDRIIRVMIAPAKNREGELLGVLEIVEDLTEVVNNPDEIKKKIVVL